MLFRVIDLTTDKEPDLRQIVLKEEWASGLLYSDVEGFAIAQDGTLALMDGLGNFRYCPLCRFDVILETIQTTAAKSGG